MDFEEPLAAGVFHRRAHPNIGHAGHRAPAVAGLNGIHAIGRELLVVRAEVRGRKAEFAAEAVSFDHRAENGELTAQHASGAREVTTLHRPANESTADDFAID